jgi:hypothetical protein
MTDRHAMQPETARSASSFRHRGLADAAEGELRLARRRRHAVIAFIACYVVGWAWLVGMTDPAGWEALLSMGFGVLFALVLLFEVVATAHSLRASAPNAPVSPDPLSAVGTVESATISSLLND